MDFYVSLTSSSHILQIPLSRVFDLDYWFHLVSNGLSPGPFLWGEPSALWVERPAVILGMPFHHSLGVGPLLLDPMISSFYIYLPKSHPLVAS